MTMGRKQASKRKVYASTLHSKLEHSTKACIRYSGRFTNVKSFLLPKHLLFAVWKPIPQDEEHWDQFPHLDHLAAHLACGEHGLVSKAAASPPGHKEELIANAVHKIV